MPASTLPPSSRISTSARSRRRSKDSGATPEDVALVLAEAKAPRSANAIRGALVLGCDQTLSLGDEVFHKPADMEGARRHLLALSGKTHQLNSAVGAGRATAKRCGRMSASPG